MYVYIDMFALYRYDFHMCVEAIWFGTCTEGSDGPTVTAAQPITQRTNQGTCHTHIKAHIHIYSTCAKYKTHRAHEA